MQATENYPTGKVIFSYALFGGAIGGIFIDFILTIIVNPSNSSFDKNFIDFLIGIFFYGFYGGIAGFSPAVFTAMILAKIHFHLKNFQSYLKLFMIGFVVSMLFFFVFFIPNFYESLFRGLKSLFTVASVGGISSLIVGKFTLPKT